MNPETRHIYKTFLAGRIRDDRQFDISLKNAAVDQTRSLSGICFSRLVLWLARGEDVVIHAV